LNGEYITLDTDRINRFKPGIEVFFFYIDSNYFETIIPYCTTAYFHFSAEFLKLGPPLRDKGDKDVKKEVIKTSDLPLDFQEKNLLWIFFL
jgi:hypothetical protein